MEEARGTGGLGRQGHCAFATCLGFGHRLEALLYRVDVIVTMDVSASYLFYSHLYII